MVSYMSTMIINADDFGLNESCTKAICSAFSQGLITDTTLVANGDAFDLAIRAISEFKLQDRVGIHLNLTQGKPLTAAILRMPTFTRNGEFHGQINRLKPLSYAEKNAVYTELSAQVRKLEEYNIVISHADSHHHTHTSFFIAPIVIRICKEHGIQKIRLHRNIGRILFYKRIIKWGFNNWLRKCGFTTTKHFGSMEDLPMSGLRESTEVMVHPDFSWEGSLVDKTDMIDGYPTGEELKCVKKDYCQQLIRYFDLG